MTLDTVLQFLATALNSTVVQVIFVIIVVLSPFLSQIRFRRKSGENDGQTVTLDSLVEARYAPGGQFYERNEAVRPVMERRGLTFCYFRYRPPAGTSPFTF